MKEIFSLSLIFFGLLLGGFSLWLSYNLLRTPELMGLSIAPIPALNLAGIMLGFGILIFVIRHHKR